MLLRRTFSVLLLCGATSFADDDLQVSAPPPPDVAAHRSDPVDTTPELAVPSETTPEMWIYSQEQKRLDDPKQIMRRRAQQEAAWRRERIAARRWYGLSNLRPTASPIPWMSASYSPTWVGSHWDPFQWSDPRAPRFTAGRPAVVYTEPIRWR